MQNVTVFFVFFMALYAIVGIQLFGRMDYHCVLPSEFIPLNVKKRGSKIIHDTCTQRIDQKLLVFVSRMS